MNDILKEQNTNEKVKKYNNYQKALYGGRDAPAVVGSSSSAATNDYNGYLSNQNATLRSQSTVAKKQRPATQMNTAAQQTQQNTQQMAQQPQQNTQASSLYDSLSSYDRGLSQEAQDKIVAAKERWQRANAANNAREKQMAYTDAQLTRAKYGGYIDDIGDGSGYAEFGYGNLSAADRDMSPEDQDEILRLQLLYRYANDDADRQYYHDAANKIRSKYGYTSSDGKSYVPNDPASDVYAGYKDFKNPYADRIDQLINYISNREYDPESDPAYQAYKAQYERNASAATNSAMAQAAGNTGGIANSYAMALGNAAQQAYMKQLSDVIPTLQQQDYADRMSLLQNLNNLQNSAYDRYANGRDFDYNAWMQAWQNVFDKNQADRDYNETIASREWQTAENQKDRDYDWSKFTFGY